jgi:hypothetical protein
MKTDVIEAKPCPSCGKAMPAGALAGLCPACLLAQGAETDAGDSPKGARFEPPSLAEIARLFPQLEIQALIGAGGMGAVYRARQPALDRVVALKILPASGADGENFEERFNREARALARLSHPNIVAVHEFGKAGSLHFFIMEFVDGANLRQLELRGRLAPREALQIIPQICDALQYAHDEGVVHRDIKPENVLVDRKGRVKIADFGLAKILGANPDTHRLTLEGQVMGTPHYMAPEQIERPLSVDHRADIYSLGVVLYEMLTGDLPLGKFPPPSRKVEVDVRLDEVVLRALENDPARRYQKASEVKMQVETIAATPSAAGLSPVREDQFIRWAGFRVIKIRDGLRRANWPQILFAFAVLFGVLTLAFGVPTLITGRSLWDWLGIVGLPSVLARLALAAGIVAFGTWRALKSEVKPPPMTPQGTAILAPEKFSRKAIIGACWAPFSLFILGLFWSVALPVGEAPTGPPWWQIGIAILTLPPACTAPFGTTILGWMAVGDIRRSRGRIRGLPLAVFDGLLFPLLALDVFLILAFIRGARLLPALQPEFAEFAEGPAGQIIGRLLPFIALAICLLVDFLIVRRVWNAVRLTARTAAPASDWWWSRKPGAIAIGLACLGLLLLVALRREQVGGFENPPEQIASRETSGALFANLPGGARMELIAIGEGLGAQAADEWWKPDGSRHLESHFEVHNPGRITTPNQREKDFIFRFAGLSDDVLLPIVECNPDSPYVTSGEALRDGQHIGDGRALRFAWPERVDRVTMRLGVGLKSWRTVGAYERANGSTRSLREAGDPNWILEFHQAGERNGRTLLTLVRGLDDGKWQTRIVAVDTNGVEHGESSSTGTRSQKSVTWTHEFALPLGQVKEFCAQIRPLHWVEFRDVALHGRGTIPPAPSRDLRSIQVAAHDRDQGRLVARWKPRGTVELLAIGDDGAAPNAWWNPQAEAIPGTLFEIVSLERAQETARVNRQFILRMRDLPSGADGPQVEFVGGYGGSSHSVLRDGKPLSGAWLLQASFPLGTAEGAVRLGFGLAAWQTVSVHGVDGNLVRREAVPGLPPVETQIHQVSEADGDAQLTMLVDYPAREWQMKIVAINRKGEENVSSASRSSHARIGEGAVWSYKFWRTPLAQVKEFRVMMRPLDWIEFRDIPLQPRDRSMLGRSTRVLAPTEWGAEKEVHITEFFDFDKGVHGVFPTAADGTQTYRGTYRNPAWARENGFDVEAGTNELRTPQMFIIDLQESEWISLTIQDLEKRMRVYYGPPVLPATRNAKLPLTYGFKTVEGAMGKFQITGFDESQAEVRLHYRVIERAHFE